MGASFRGGGAVHTLNSGVAHSDSREKQISWVWKLSNKWSLHSGPFRPLFCSHLYLLISYWCPHVPRRIINPPIHSWLHHLIPMICTVLLICVSLSMFDSICQEIDSKIFHLKYYWSGYLILHFFASLVYI